MSVADALGISQPQGPARARGDVGNNRVYPLGTEALAVLDPYPIAHMTGEHDDTKE